MERRTDMETSEQTKRNASLKNLVWQSSQLRAKKGSQRACIGAETAPKMPGRLAGLFSTTTSASQQAQQLEQPAAASKLTALPDICEQLRAVSDAETVLTGKHVGTRAEIGLTRIATGRKRKPLFSAGLHNLGEMLRRSDAEEIRNSIVRLSPRLEELSVMWETQALVTDDSYSFFELHCVSISQLIMPQYSCRFATNTSAQLCCLYLHS